MAVKLNPEEIAVLKAFKAKLQKGDITWIQSDKEIRDSAIRNNIKAFLLEKGINIFKGMTSLPAGFFYGAKMDSVTIPDTITSIGEKVFAGSSIKTIILEDGVATIGPKAFAGSSVSNIELPNSITSIGKNAFAECKNLAELFLPDSITEIRADLFEGDDQINIWANPRKGSSRLKCPEADIEWFKQHLFKYKGE